MQRTPRKAGVPCSARGRGLRASTRLLWHCGFLENAGACKKSNRNVIMRPRSLIGSIHPRLAVVVHDLAMVWIAWISTNWLRYSLEVNPPAFAWFTPEIGIV